MGDWRKGRGGRSGGLGRGVKGERGERVLYLLYLPVTRLQAGWIVAMHAWWMEGGVGVGALLQSLCELTIIEDLRRGRAR